MDDKLERIQRTSLWTGMEEKKRLALVNWDKVRYLKNNGGLGIRKFSQFNKALIAKFGWKLANENADWCHIMSAKYLDQDKFHKILNLEGVPSGSKIWSNILNYRDIISHGLRWLISNGRSIHF